MCLRRYAEEWWRATDGRHRNRRVITAGRLVSAWRASYTNHMVGKPVRGPIGHMLKQLSHAGWTPVNPTCFRDRQGKDVCLLSISPVMLARRYMADAVAETRLRADLKVRKLAGYEGLPQGLGEPLVGGGRDFPHQ